jgi:hypothetical protein
MIFKFAIESRDSKFDNYSSVLSALSQNLFTSPLLIPFFSATLGLASPEIH